MPTRLLPTSHLAKERDSTALPSNADAHVPIQVVLVYSSQISVAFEEQSDVRNHAYVKRILSRKEKPEIDRRAVYLLLDGYNATSLYMLRSRRPARSLMSAFSRGHLFRGWLYVCCMYIVQHVG